MVPYVWVKDLIRICCLNGRWPKRALPRAGGVDAPRTAASPRFHPPQPGQQHYRLAEGAAFVRCASSALQLSSCKRPQKKRHGTLLRGRQAQICKCGVKSVNCGANWQNMFLKVVVFGQLETLPLVRPLAGAEVSNARGMSPTTLEKPGPSCMRTRWCWSVPLSPFWVGFARSLYCVSGTGHLQYFHFATLEHRSQVLSTCHGNFKSEV